MHLRKHHPDVAVHETELPPGYMGCTDHARRVIWLDSRLTCAEQRATLAHEIGHLELDTVHDGEVAMAAEAVVDAWAARKLISAADLVSAFRCCPHLADIAEELWVDLDTVRARLGCLTDDEHDMVIRAIEKRGAVA